MEGKTHRWLSSVNAIPGGLPARDVMTNHRPEPKQHPGLVVVGDYLFDSTLNGLLDSSDAATDIILTEMIKLRHARRQDGNATSDKIDRDYFAELSRAGSLQRGLEPVHRSRLPDGTDQDRLEQGQRLQAAGGRVCQRRTGRRVARTRHRCMGHREQPGDSCENPKSAEEIQQARNDRRSAVQGRRVRFRVRNQPLPCRGKAGAARRPRAQPRRRDRPACSGRSLPTWRRR